MIMVYLDAAMERIHEVWNPINLERQEFIERLVRMVTDGQPLRGGPYLTYSMRRTFARIMVWDCPNWSFSYMLTFSAIYWLLICLGLRSFTAAGCAVVLALVPFTFVQPRDSADLDDIDENGFFWNRRAQEPRPPVKNMTLKDIRLERSLTELFKVVNERLRLVVHDYMKDGKDPATMFCISMLVASILIFFLRNTVGNSMLMFAFWLVHLMAPYCAFNYQFSQPRRQSDTEIEEFEFAVTEDNFKVLNRAGETGDHSPTPPRLDTSASNGSLGLVIPYPEGDITEEFNIFDLEEYHEDMLEYDSSDSSSEDEEIALQPRINIVNVEEDDDDSSDDLDDFEVIQPEEIADIINRHDD